MSRIRYFSITLLSVGIYTTTLISTSAVTTSVATTSTVTTKTLDKVEQFFGDFLNPFAAPPAQAEVKALSSDSNGFKNKTLVGFDFSNGTWTGCDFSNTDLTGANFSNSDVSNAVFTNAVLQNANFEGCTITLDQLKSAKTFNGAWFSGNTQFQNCNFTGLSLIGCSFENCNLTSSIFDNALLDSVDFSGATISNASFKNAHITSNAQFNKAIADEADFTGTSLSAATIRTLYSYQKINLTNINFSNQDLSYLNFTNCILTGCNLTNADCTGTNFTNAIISVKELSPAKTLRNAILYKLKLDGFNFSDKSLQEATISHCSCKNCIFDKSDFDKATVLYNNFTSSSFKKCSFNNVGIHECILDNCDFTQAAISHIDFRSCSLLNAVLDYSNPTHTFFTSKIISDVSLSRAFGPDLAPEGNTEVCGNGSYSGAVTVDNPTLNMHLDTKNIFYICPVDSKSLDTNLRLTTSEWSQESYEGVYSMPEIAGVQFYGLRYLDPKDNGFAPTSGADSIGLLLTDKFEGSVLSLQIKFGDNFYIAPIIYDPISNTYSRPVEQYCAWNQINVNLSFPSQRFIPKNSDNKNFSSANMTYFSFSSQSYRNYNFSNVQFVGSDFTSSDLTGSNLSYANFTGATLTNANLSNTTCSNAKLWGDLQGANFTNAIIDHVDFTFSTNLTGAQIMQTQKDHPGVNLQSLTLQSCDFSGRNFSGADLTLTDFSYSRFDNSIFAGIQLEQTNFNNASLRNCDFTTAQFTNVTLRGADLRGANLKGASINACDFRGAIFSSWDQLQQANVTQYNFFDNPLRIEK